MPVPPEPVPPEPAPTAYPDDAVGRLVPEPAKRSRRSAFQRDRARVLHSASLRRLADTTQVVGPGTHDFVRNRLTHSLEVGQVARELGGSVGCDPDLVETAALAHDLGHPPFGHNGEQVLDRLAARCGGFEGNAQTLRVLTRLEPKTADDRGRSVGLNLTRATLDAASKYPWPRTTGVAKFGVYDDDLDVFGWFRDGVTGARRCVEAQVMDLADDIAYSVHDVEDGIVAGRVDLAHLQLADERAVVFAVAREWYDPTADDARLDAALERLHGLEAWPHGRFDGSRPALAVLKRLTSGLIGRFCALTTEATRRRHGPEPLVRHGGDLVVPAEVHDEITLLKATAAHYVMRTQDRLAEMERQQQQLVELTVGLLDSAPRSLTPVFAADWQGAADDDERVRVVVDQVASLTDVSARAWHRHWA